MTEAETIEVEANFVAAVRLLVNGLHRVEEGECIHKNLWVVGEWDVIAVRGHLEAIDRSREVEG